MKLHENAALFFALIKVNSNMIDMHFDKKLNRQFDDNIKQIESRIKIYDDMNNLKFFASLNQENPVFPGEVKGYTVSVVSFCFAQNKPTLILEKFFQFLPDAQKFYDDTVKRYSRIAKMETIDVENINLYAYKINYRCSKHCCATCKFCKPQFLDPRADTKIDQYHLESYLEDTHLYEPYKGKLVCVNAKLFEPYHVINDLDKFPDRSHNSYNDYIYNEKVNHIPPRVSPECICDFYEEDRNSWRRYYYYNNNPHTLHHIAEPKPNDKGKMW